MSGSGKPGDKQAGSEPLDGPVPASAYPHVFAPTPLPYGTPIPQQRVEVSYSREFRIGPLPDAEEFGRFKAVHPPAADWILAEAGKNGDHTRAMERIGAKVAAREALLIRLLPFGVVVLFMLVFGAITFVNAWVGAVGLATTFAAVVLAYLRGFGMTAGDDAGPTPTVSQAGETPQVPHRKPKS